ncbi:MAG: thiosulfate oxidation carrier protein SoxY [Gammaproteobacteria bacterium]
MTTDSKRRLFLKGSLITGLLTLAASLGLLAPIRALAAWPATAFDAKKVDTALNTLFGNSNLIDRSADITLTAPDLAENGAVVPVTVQSTLEGIESITLLVDKNPNALVARFNLAKNAQPYIKTNIKMAETSNLIAVLKAGDRLYSTSIKVKVTLNGCGN